MPRVKLKKNQASSLETAFIYKVRPLGPGTAPNTGRQKAGNFTGERKFHIAELREKTARLMAD